MKTKIYMYRKPTTYGIRRFPPPRWKIHTLWRNWFLRNMVILYNYHNNITYILYMRPLFHGPHSSKMLTDIISLLISSDSRSLYSYRLCIRFSRGYLHSAHTLCSATWQPHVVRIPPPWGHREHRLLYHLIISTSKKTQYQSINKSIKLQVTNQQL